jgi:CheY-like chemotaxis protein
MAGDRDKALEAGCNGYIEKPINPEIFMQQIEEYLPSPH